MKALPFEILGETYLCMVEKERYIIATILVLDSGIGVGEEIEVVLAAQTDEIAEDSIPSLLLVEVCHVLLAEGRDRTALDDGAELLFLQHFYRKPKFLAPQEILNDTLKAKTRGILSSNGTISSEEACEPSLIFL
jgi:hypothetical protein